MKFIDEYRDPESAKSFSKAIRQMTTREWTIMEVCGGQTHAIVKFGIEELLPESITLLHGPGCPVCVTPVELIDKAIEISLTQDVILCSFGDMLRVPGTRRDLLSAKSEGADLRIVYSPLDVLKICSENPDREVVFFAVGFETTAPATAMAVYQAHKKDIKNFSMLISHVLVPPAMESILSSPERKIDGFLAAGHVCTVMGYREYEPISRNYKVPVVVTGFEPLDILHGIYMCVKQLENGQSLVENQYSRSVREQGNENARSLIEDVFEAVPRKWRGIGEIPRSGLGLREKYRDFDAEKRFGLAEYGTEEQTECISGLVLKGLKKPHECPAFATRCTPENPLGATMVSSEGACAAYYRYGDRQSR